MLKNNLGEQLTDQKNLNEYVETDYVIFQGPKKGPKIYTIFRRKYNTI